MFSSNYLNSLMSRLRVRHSRVLRKCYSKKRKLASGLSFCKTFTQTDNMLPVTYLCIRPISTSCASWNESKERPPVAESMASLLAESIAEKNFQDWSEKEETNVNELSLQDLKQRYELLTKDLNQEYRALIKSGDELIRLDDDEDNLSTEDKLSDYFVEEINLESPKAVKEKTKSVYGTADPSVAFSDIPCGGCGAILHCQNSSIPGYIPKEKFLMLDKFDLKRSTCQRCYLIDYHNFYLNVKTTAEQYPSIISEIKKRRGLVILVVDLLDIPNSFIQDLPNLVGRKRDFFVVGNKVDLIPKVSRGYLHHIKSCLQDWSVKSGLAPSQVLHTCLISAKTGYGIEYLITKLIKEFYVPKQGDVFLLGSTNSGKSSLFNILLSSDYCKYHVRDAVHRATVSRWPGTTLDLLKFPIFTPTKKRLALRSERLNREKWQFKREVQLSSQRGYRKDHLEEGQDIELAAPVGQTDFRSENTLMEVEKKIGGEIRSEDLSVPPSYSFSDEGQVIVGNKTQTELHRETRHERKERKSLIENLQRLETASSWLYDTPGLVNPNQIMNMLRPNEMSMVTPRGLISPRTFIVKPGQVMFVSGLGRIDYIEGNVSIYFTVITAQDIRLCVLNKEEADQFYQTHAGTKRLGVPSGGRDRLLSLPSLIGKEFELQGIGWKQSAGDIVLSSLGFVSVAVQENHVVRVRAFTPGGKGCNLVTPSLLPEAVCLRGQRVKGTTQYRVRPRKTAINKGR